MSKVHKRYIVTYTKFNKNKYICFDNIDNSCYAINKTIFYTHIIYSILY